MQEKKIHLLNNHNKPKLEIGKNYQKKNNNNQVSDISQLVRF